MGYGLRVWNAAGQPIFDTSDRLSRVFGTIFVPANTSGGSVTLPTGYGDYWYAVQAAGGGLYQCSVNISGNTLTYGASTFFGPAVDCILLYGAY
jgi:hypothetical protein